MKIVTVNFEAHNAQAVAELLNDHRNAVDLLAADERFRESAELNCDCGVQLRIAAKDVKPQMDIRTALSVLTRLVRAYSAADHIYNHRDETDAMKAVGGGCAMRSQVCTQDYKSQ